MIASLLRTAIAALALCAGSTAQAVTDLVEGAPVSVLVEEELLSSDEREIPADGRIDLRLPEGLPETALRLEDFTFDPRSGLFAARVIGVDGLTLTFRGQAMVTVPTYVPRRRIPAGVKLTEQDFRLVHMNVVALPAGAVRHAEDILGMESRRVLLQDRPILAGSISEPRVVTRGEKVTIILSNGGLDLSAPGKALEDGARGDAVRVVNLGSHVTLSATVIGEGVVEVAAK
ncbi:flagellar basal body P-ring formation chaperone FlgA [Psychromarinibacter sp. S121]|uniref:flagellar basal body P-ring formation chaperone FlgA n=1 Tax=Psychromarinibacter sp. S121 TaxID=3415127 RepID=UPI003C7B9ECD